MEFKSAIDSAALCAAHIKIESDTSLTLLARAINYLKPHNSDHILTEREKEVFKKVCSELNRKLAAMRKNTDDLRFIVSSLERSLYSGQAKSKET